MGWEYLIEILFGLGQIVNASLFIPQAIKLYKTKDPESLSLITFIGFNIIQIITIGHGFIAKDYLLIGGTVANMLTSGIITVMILYYRLK